MKKQYIKKITIASLFMGSVIATGLGLGISLANNTNNNNNVSNVLLKEANKNISSKAINTTANPILNFAFAGDITTWGLGVADGSGGVDELLKPAWNAETGVFTVPNYVTKLLTSVNTVVGAKHYDTITGATPGGLNPVNPWISEVKEIRFQKNSKLVEVGSGVFNYMSTLTKVYFPQPSESFNTETQKITFHNGMYLATAEEPGLSTQIDGRGNFSIQQYSKFTQPAKHIMREIVYPANMKYRALTTDNSISTTGLTPLVLRDFIMGGSGFKTFDNKIVYNEKQVESTAVNSIYYNNVIISIPNTLEIKELYRYQMSYMTGSGSIFNSINGPVNSANKWFLDHYNWFEVKKTTVGEVNHYEPALNIIKTTTDEISLLAAAQTAFSNKYYEFSKEWAVFNKTFNEPVEAISQVAYLANLNTDWNRIANLMGGFGKVPEIGIVGNQYETLGQGAAGNVKNQIFGYNQSADGTKKVGYTANLIGNQGYLINDKTDADNPYFRAISLTPVVGNNANWEKYTLTEEDETLVPTVYRQGTYNAIDSKSYNFTTKHRLSGNSIYNTLTKTLEIPEYVTTIANTPPRLTGNSVFGENNVANWNFLWTNTKNSAKHIKVNDYLVTEYEVANVGNQNEAKPKNAESVSSSLKTIGSFAFSNFSALNTFSTPKTVTSIGEGFLSDSILLEAVILPKGLTTLAKGAFSGSTNLKRFTMPTFGNAESPVTIDYTDMLKGITPTDIFIPFVDQAKFVASNYGNWDKATPSSAVHYYGVDDLISASISVDINNVDYNALISAAQAVNTAAADTDPTLQAALDALILEFNNNYVVDAGEANLTKKSAWFSGTSELLLNDATLATLKVAITGGKITFTGGALVDPLGINKVLDFSVNSDTNKLDTFIDVGTYETLFGPLTLGTLLNANSDTPLITVPSTNTVGNVFMWIGIGIGIAAALLIAVVIVFIVRRNKISKAKALGTDTSSNDSVDASK